MRCLIDLEEYREAEIWLKKALGLYPGNAGLLSVKALVECHKGMHDNAMAASDEALSLKGDNNPSFWIDRGTVLLLNGNIETAGSNFEKVLEGPEGQDWFWLTRIGMAYLKGGKALRAADTIQKAAEMSPSHPFLWLKLAQAHRACSHIPKAREALMKVLELNPSHEQAQALLNKINKNACFIATCLELGDSRLAYMRSTRDAMRTLPGGEGLWKAYCAISPPVVEILIRHPVLRSQCRNAAASCVDFLMNYCKRK